MNDNTYRDELRETYNRHALERDAYAPEDWKIEERAAFLARLRAENKSGLLEIGAGPGRDSRFFMDEGLAVTSIDLSPAMVDLCRQKGLKAEVMDVCALRFAPASFDAVYAMNSLLHLPKAELPGALAEIDAVLRPDGLFYMGVYGSDDHEGVWENDRYTPKRFFSSFSDEHLCAEVTRVFDLLSFKPIYFGPEDPIHYQSLTLRKRKGG